MISFDSQRQSVLPLLTLLLAVAVPRGAASQKAWQAEPDRARIERFHAGVTQYLRMAGTKEGKLAAEYVSARFLEAGLLVETKEYEVWLSRPKKAELTLLLEKPKKLPLAEKGFAWDKDSYSAKERPAFSAYAKSAKLTARVVYANYGLEADYAALAKLGVDVKGRIVLVRYGRCFRGIKLKTAHAHGAAAVLLYTDPGDSGYVRGDMYPRGRMANETAIQRGSCLYSFEYPGDPLTPGEAALPGIKRLRPEAAAAIPRISAMPIPWAAAAPILENLAGPVVPEGWQGGLPFTYHTGPGTAQVAYEVENEGYKGKVRNVIGVLEGKSGKKGPFVLMGNHRDSWVNGAIDPGSGTACLLETATMLGTRAKAGWKPERTMRFASWDGEEFGIIGSTEYGEEHAEFLKRNLIAYLNADAVVSGARLGVSCSPALRRTALSLLEGLPHPDSGKDLRDTVRGVPGSLGGGSDFAVFVARLGVPCLQFGMGGRNGVYHSAYDTHWFMKERIDPGFRYHATLSKLFAKTLLRLSEAKGVHFDPSAAVQDLLLWLVAEKKRLPEPLREKLQQEAERTIAAWRNLTGKQRQSALAVSSSLRSWLDPTGLFGRPWYHNLYIAADRKNGYSALAFPGLSEALDAADTDRIAYEADRLAACMQRLRKAMTAIHGD